MKYKSGDLIDKPWGYEKIIEFNEKYMVKELFMKAGNQCSLQYHNFKTETIYVLDGELEIIKGSIKKNSGNLNQEKYTKGDVITLYPGDVHRMRAKSDCLYLEASTSEMDDVVRLKDDYNRDS